MFELILKEGAHSLRRCSVLRRLNAIDLLACSAVIDRLIFCISVDYFRTDTPKAGPVRIAI